MRDQAEREMNNIRKRADQQVERLEQVWDRFKNLKVQDLEGDEILYREMRTASVSTSRAAWAPRRSRSASSPSTSTPRPTCARSSPPARARRRPVPSSGSRSSPRSTTTNTRRAWSSTRPGHPAGPAPDGAARRWPLRDLDLNDLYRRVINRNNRLKRLLDLGAPEIIVNNEKRMLQEAVDSLFDNGRRGRPVTGPGNRPLKSLSDMLKGKQGRFRQNLLGKRVDYSGRLGHRRRPAACCTSGLPKQMALELFKPFVMKRLVDLDHAQNIKSAKRMVERACPVVWDVLEEVITEHPVLLNRAPTPHRLGIQAFEPQLVEGKAIQIHPLVCSAFNADFDGTRWPLSTCRCRAEAQAEARILMLSSNNILKPADGRPVTMPTQDMIIGMFHLTDAVDGGGIGAGRVHVAVGGPHGLRPWRARARLGDQAASHRRGAPARLRAARGCRGRRGRHRPEHHARDDAGSRDLQRHAAADYPFENRPVDKQAALGDRQRPRRALLQGAGRRIPRRPQGGRLYWSTRSGCTVAISDVTTPDNKTAILEGYEAKAAKVQTQYERGLITDDERRQELIEIWTQASNQVAKEMETNFPRTNPIYRMVSSGAGGNWMQIRQIAGMRGLVANPKGEIIPRPIKANFREGLSGARVLHLDARCP